MAQCLAKKGENRETNIRVDLEIGQDACFQIFNYPVFINIFTSHFILFAV
jgi:hypothetical protein